MARRAVQWACIQVIAAAQWVWWLVDSPVGEDADHGGLFDAGGLGDFALGESALVDGFLDDPVS